MKGGPEAFISSNKIANLFSVSSFAIRDLPFEYETVLIHSPNQKSAIS